MSAAAFDAAGFVAELRAAGLTVGIGRDVPRGGEVAGPPSYFVRAPAGQGLGDAYAAVLERWRDAMGAHADHPQAVVAYLTALNPATFDPAAFVSDLQAAGCVVVLSQPGTVFRPGDEVASWSIQPSRDYTAVMAKWADAMDACPDHVERVTALLVERWEAGA